MVRFILAASFVVIFLILSIPLMLIELIIGLFSQKAKDVSSLALVNWAFRVVRFISGTKLIVLGRDNIPADTPVLFVGNHRSFFDIVLNYPLMKMPTGFIAKKELGKVPLLNVWMLFLHCTFLDRKNTKEGMKTILGCVEEVKKGYSMFIFPEGTRNKVNDTFLMFHNGSFKIADKANVPVVPVTILNSAAVFEDHLPKIRKTTVVIEFGEPVDLNSLEKEDKKNVGDYFCNLISQTYFKNKEEYKL